MVTYPIRRGEIKWSTDCLKPFVFFFCSNCKAGMHDEITQIAFIIENERDFMRDAHPIQSAHPQEKALPLTVSLARRAHFGAKLVCWQLFANKFPGMRWRTTNSFRA